MIAFTLVATLVALGPAKAGHYVQQSGGQAGSDARQITLAIPETVLEIDTSNSKAQPVVLAWSPDGKALYIQAVERDRQGAVTATKHYVVVIAAKSIRGVDLQPAWASKYWLWKSAQASPAAPAFKINVDSRQETKRATAAVGDLAKGGGPGGDGLAISGTTAEEAANIASQSQTLNIYALKLKGATLGEWTNEPVIPGLNFGWAPAPSHLIVYAKREGGPLIVVDEQGRKQELTGAKNAVLPAWSPDGMKLAWLERKDRKKFDLMIADVATQ